MRTAEQKARYAAHNRARYALVRERKIAQASEYYAANKEKVLARLKAKNHTKAAADGRRPGVVGAPRKFSDAERRDRQLKILRAWRASNPDKMKAQTKRHYDNKRDVFIANMHRRRAATNGSNGTYTPEDIAALLKKQKGKCVFCLQEFGAERPEVDHYIPLALGGSNDRGNLRLLHKICNRMKRAKHPADFGLRHGLLAW